MTRQHFSTCFFVPICLLAACAGDLGVDGLTEDTSLVGKWESVARSQGGIGHTFEFHSDSTASLTPGAMVDFTYRLEGAQLVMVFTDPSSGSVTEDTVEVHISGDTMIQRDPESGQETRLVRSKAPEAGNPPIVGAWSFEHYTGGTAFQIFTADGKAHLRVPFDVERGRFTVSGHTLTLFMKETLVYRYTIDGAVLTLTPADGRPRQYQRVPW